MTSSQIDAVAAARAGDEAAFGALFERHRRELHVHCYRMLGSRHEAEDLTQETFLRAWRSRATYRARASFRAWLYRIATNACLDALGRRPRRPESGEVSWLQPYPDTLLDELAAGEEDEPDAVVVARETIELAFMVAIQHLPPRSRAVLILRDVLGWSAKDTAELLETSVPAANSALQRARAALKEHLPERRLDWAGTDPTSEERALVQRYIEAGEQGDAEALAATLREDARFSMPPQPGLYEGRDEIKRIWCEGGFGTPEFSDFRSIITSANRQPAVACYAKRQGQDAYTALAIDVLRIEPGGIAEVIAFDSSHFDAFGLPPSL